MLQQTDVHESITKQDRNNINHPQKKHRFGILIPVSSKSVEKRRGCGRLNIYKWTVIDAAIL